ncbi:MAG: serine/threonine protein kinase [Burkholderiales bacterium]
MPILDSSASPHPFTDLTPDTVLDALASVGLHGDGRLLALNSYENRVYLVHLEPGDLALPAVVVKFYRPGRWSRAQILEEHAFSAELMQGEIPVVGPLLLQGGGSATGPATLHQHAGFDFSVSPRRGGRAPELDDDTHLEWIGRLLARLHNVGARQPFAYRPALDVQQFAIEPREWLLTHQRVAPEVENEWASACATAIECIQASGLAQADTLRLHGDCHPGNILWTPEVSAPAGAIAHDAGGQHFPPGRPKGNDGPLGGQGVTRSERPWGLQTPGPHFVDLDDARSGPAVQDLWMLLSGERHQRSRALGTLLDGYETLRAFDRRELALIEPLRTLRLIHYSAWLARRWSDPIFPANFPWFGSRDYWAGQVQMLQEQIEAMQEPPLVC